MKASNERGIAMILALFMVMALSVIGSSLMFISRTETISSQNYRLMSQARFGAEAGIHQAANYLMWTYPAPTGPGTSGDPIDGFTITTSPVQWNNAPVVLSSNAGASNYPVAGVKTAFAAVATGTLEASSESNVHQSSITYDTTATLMSMRGFTDDTSGQWVTLQTWQLTSTGTSAGANPATVEVVSVLERHPSPIYAYAAFATYNGCAALSFAGGATTNSYDSRTLPATSATPPATDNWGGNVGTNGNLTEVGNPTTINGSMSTPRTGVGNCTTNNVTAYTSSGLASVSEGLNQLSQEIAYPTPAITAPGSGSQQFKKNNGCPSGYNSPACTVNSDGQTLTPGGPSSVMQLGNITVTSGTVLHLNAGIYAVNSFKMEGNSQIVIDSGPVVFQVTGTNDTEPIVITGNGIVNTTYRPTDLKFQYAGTGNVKMAGGDNTSALFYAPNATGAFSGGMDLYGAVIVKQLTATGGASIHYDRALQGSGFTGGARTLSAFTWKTY
jgi:hypothetical protein